jgi:ankyrin repeat protein
MYKFYRQTLSFLLPHLAPIFVAATEGDLVSVEAALESGIDLFIRNQDGETLLHIAAQQGHFPLVRLLLDRGLRATILNARDKTPVYEAVKYGHKKIVALLAQSIAASESNLYSEIDAFLCAAEMDWVEMLELLLNNNPRLINCRGGQYGETALHTAARYNHIHSVRWLLKRGAKINLKNILEGNTALILSLQHNHMGASRAVIKALLWYGANPNIENHQGDTAGHKAAQYCDLDIMQCLIDHDVNITLLSRLSGHTLLHSAAYSAYPNVIQLLLASDENKVLLNREDFTRNTPLHIAARHGNLEAVHLLLSCGAEIDRLNRDHDSALHLAVRSDQLEVVKILLGHSLVHLNTKGYFNIIPLQEALLCSNWNMAALLLLSSAAANFHYSKPLIVYNWNPRKFSDKYLIKKTLTKLISNQVIRGNITKQFELFFQIPLTSGQYTAAEIWWRLPRDYREILFILANTVSQENKPSKACFADLPFEVRQFIVYYMIVNSFSLRPYLDKKTLINGMGFLLEWLASRKLKGNNPFEQNTTTWCPMRYTSVLNPWIGQERARIDQKAEQAAKTIMDMYL